MGQRLALGHSKSVCPLSDVVCGQHTWLYIMMYVYIHTIYVSCMFLWNTKNTRTHVSSIWKTCCCCTLFLIELMVRYVIYFWMTLCLDRRSSDAVRTYRLADKGAKNWWRRVWKNLCRVGKALRQSTELQCNRFSRNYINAFVNKDRLDIMNIYLFAHRLETTFMCRVYGGI